VLNLLKGRLREEEIIYIVGLPQGSRTDKVKSFVETGQIVLLDDIKAILNVSATRDSLLLVISSDDLKAAGKLPIKTEQVDLSNLKKMLEEGLVDDLLIKSDGKPKAADADIGAAKEVSNFALGAQEVTPMQRFCKTFLEYAADETDGVVGSVTVTRIIKSIDDFEKTNATLAAGGWLEPFRKDGASKIGGYTATDKLREEVGQVLVVDEPTNPFERAQLLVSLKPGYEAKKKELQAQITELDAQIKRAEDAEKWLEKGADF